MKPTEAASKFNIVIFKETSSFILSVTVKDALTVTSKKPIYNKKYKHQQYTNLRLLRDFIMKMCLKKHFLSYFSH